MEDDIPCAPGTIVWYEGGSPIPRWLERELERDASKPASEAQVRYLRALGLPSNGLSSADASKAIDTAKRANARARVAAVTK